MRLQLGRAGVLTRAGLGAFAALALLLSSPSVQATKRDGKARASQPKDSRAQEAGGDLGTAFYVRTDSDQTVVITPSVHFRKTLGPSKKTGLTVGYLADVWSSASVDIRSAASEKVVEQRDEVVAGIDHEQGLWTFGAGYRNSYETDYLSNSISLATKYEAFERNTAFEFRLSGAMDKVGRSGDASFAEDVRTVSAWLGVTQVLTKKLILQGSAEWRWSKGFLSSPYRYVPIGADLKNCQTPQGYCLPEAHPGMRGRVAAVLRTRYALNQKMSVGAGYRFYYDQWRVQSNTATLDFAARVAKGLVLVADGRFYQQSAAFFYAPEYSSKSLVDKGSDSSYITRDRELSGMWNWRAGLRAEYASPLNSAGIGAKAGLMSAVTQYHYPEFLALDKVNALELACSLGVVF